MMEHPEKLETLIDIRFDNTITLIRHINCLPLTATGLSGEPGLVDRVLALHAGSRGFDFHRGTCPNDFSDPTDQDIRTQ